MEPHDFCIFDETSESFGMIQSTGGETEITKVITSNFP